MKKFLLPFSFLVSGFVWSQTTATWNGSTSSMMESTNWSPQTTPGASSQDLLNFPPNASLNLTPSNDIGTYLLYNYPGSGAASLGLTTPANTFYTLSGMPLQVVSSGVARIQLGGPGTHASIIQNAIQLNNGALQFLGSAYDQIQGVISGTGTSVSVVGGSIQFSSAMMYTAPTTVTAGTLQAGANNALPTSTSLTVAAAGIFDLNGFTQTIQQLSGAGNLYTKAGSLTFTNTGTNSFSGPIGLTGSPPLAGNTGGTLIMGMSSTGTFTLSAGNSYSSATQPGNTQVLGGTLVAGTATAFGQNSNIAIGSGATLNVNNFTMILGGLSGAGTLQLGTGAVTFARGGTFTGTITGSAAATSNALTYTGASGTTLTLSGTNSYTGITTIYGPYPNPAAGGVLSVSTLSSSVSFESQGGTLQFGTPHTYDPSLIMTLAAGTGYSSILDLNGNNITWRGQVTGGGGPLTVTSGSAATLILTGEGTTMNNYSAGTVINGAATLQINAATAFYSPAGVGSALSIASTATFNMNSVSGVIVSALSGSGALQLGSGTITVFGGNTGTTTNFSGNISGTGGFTYSGNTGIAEQLTPASGVNSYSGATTLNGLGTLGVTNSGLSSSSSGIVFSGSGGVLQALNAISSALPITLSAAGTFNANTYASTLTGKITGSGSFTVTGTTGSVTLTPGIASNYTGATNVYGGTLIAGNANAFGATQFIDVKPNATLNLNNQSLSIQQLIGDPGATVLLGSGTLTITAGQDTSPYYGVISGSGNMVLSTGGAPTLMGTNTYTGSTTIQGGVTLNTVNLGATSSVIFGTGGGILQIGSNCSSTAALTLNGAGEIATNTFNLSISGNITGAGASLTKIGQGTLTLTGTNMFTNALYLEGGVLNVTSASLGTPSSITYQNFCGTLQSSATFSKSFPITLVTTGVFDVASMQTITLSGDITNPNLDAATIGYGGLTKSSPGTLSLTGTNTYAGVTTIQDGILLAGATGIPLPSAGNSMAMPPVSPLAPMLVFNASTGGNPVFKANATFTSFPSVVFISSGTIDTNGNAITIVDVAGAPFPSIVAGGTTATFTKAGMGTLTLSGANIYTGPTAVTAGTLQAGVSTVSGVSGAFGVNSAVTISSGATLALNSHSNSIGSLSGASGASVTLGSGNLTISNSTPTTATYSGDMSGTGGLILATGMNQTLSGGTINIGPSTIQSGATLQIQGATTTVGSLTNDGTLQANGLITATTTYSQAAGAVLTLDFASLVNYGHISATNAITLASSAGSTLNITNSGLVTPTGTISLLHGSSIANQFTIGTNAFTKATIAYTATDVNLVFSSPSGCQGSWAYAASGSANWGVNTNWSTMSCYPGTNSASAEDAATFPTVAQATMQVTLSDGSSAITALTLHSINFTASATNYQIVKSGSTITAFAMDGNPGSNPTIAVSAGSHSLEGHITYNQDGTLALTGGTLTLPSTASVLGSGATLTISGPSGTLVANAPVNVKNIAMTGGTITNSSTFQASNSLTISGGTFTNSSGGVFGNGSTPLTISGGAVTNSTGGTTRASALSVTGGTLTTQAPIAVTTYTQGSSGSLTLDFPTSSTSSFGQINATGDLGLNGTLTLTNTGHAAAPTSGEFVLLTGNSLNSTRFGSTNTSIFPTGTLTYSSNQVLLVFTPSGPCTGVWTATSSGDWGVLANWSGCIPGLTTSTQDTATLGSVSSGSGGITITLHDPVMNPIDVSLNQLSFNNATRSYTINQAAGNLGSISMVGTSPATINAAGGSHTINAPIALKQNTVIAFSNNSTLTLGSAAAVSIGSGTPSLTVQGSSGTLVNQSSIAPTTMVISGGTFTNSGSLSPASSLTISGGAVTNTSSGLIGTQALTISSGSLSLGKQVSLNTYTQTGGTLTLDFPSLPPGYGNILASGIVSMGGTLNITNSGSVSPTGQVTLLQGSSLTHTFSLINNAFTNATVHTTNTQLYLNFGSGASCQGIWVDSANGNWGATANWQGGTCFPGNMSLASDEDTATFNNVSAGAVTVTLANSAGNTALGVSSLYQINFNASTTQYTIAQYMGAGSITLGSLDPSLPASINLSQGTHTLNAPVALGVNTTLQLTSGTLTFGSAAAVTGAYTLTAQGTSGTWTNNATINPTFVVLESGTINNLGTITSTGLTIGANTSDTLTLTNFNTMNPTGSIAISGAGTTSVTNLLTMTSGTTFTIGQTGSPSVFNTHTLSAGSTFAIAGGTVTNTVGGAIHSTTGLTISGGVITNSLGGAIYAPTGQTMTISGGTVINESFSVIGSQDVANLADNLVISGGSVTNIEAYAVAQAVHISGGTITNNSAGQFFSQGGNMTITGGTILNDTLSFFYAAGTGGNVVISGGNITNGQLSLFYSDAGNITFSGGSLVNNGIVSAVDYTQSGSAALTLGVINPLQYASVDVSGTASLGGTLTVNALSGFDMPPGTTVNLITATDKVSNTFANVSFTNFPSSLIAQLNYLSNAVELQIDQTIPAHINGGSSQIVFSSINQHNTFLTEKMYQMRNRMRGSSQSATVTADSSSTEEGLTASNEDLFAQGVPNQKQSQLRQKIEEEAIPEKPWNVYAGPVSSFGNVKTVADQIGVTHVSAGGLAGFDYIFSESCKEGYRSGIGAIVEYRKKWVDAKENFGTATIDKLHGSVYGTVVPKSIPDLAFDGILGFAYTWDHLKRHAGTSKQLTAFATTSERIFDALFDIEYTFSKRAYASMPKSLSITPLANVQYVINQICGYTEHGAGIYDLKVQSQKIQSLTTNLGTRIDWLYTASSSTFQVEIDAGWQYQYFNLNQRLGFTAFNFTDQPTFITSTAPGRSSLLAALDLLWTHNSGWELEILATYQLNKLFYDAFFYVGLGKEF